MRLPDAPKITAAPFWLVLYLRFRIWLGLKFVQQPKRRPVRRSDELGPSSVIRIGFGQCIKTGIRPNELHALDNVHRNTNRSCA